jgi:hypothetical protein
MPKDALPENDAQSTLQMSVDFAGTFLFAVEGATAAVLSDLDFFGVMVLGFTTALVGDVVRDLLIGAVPPRSIRDWRFPVVAFTGAGVVFFLHRYVQRIPSPVMVTLDAACLGLFAVAGAEKALAYQINPFIATLMGTITAVGGGTVRDILLGAGSKRSSFRCLCDLCLAGVGGPGSEPCNGVAAHPVSCAWSALGNIGAYRQHSRRNGVQKWHVTFSNREPGTEIHVLGMNS